jgi:hypothetical protein
MTMEMIGDMAIVRVSIDVGDLNEYRFSFKFAPQDVAMLAKALQDGGIDKLHVPLYWHVLDLIQRIYPEQPKA